MVTLATVQLCLLDPPPQTRLSDPQLKRDLRDRTLALTHQRQRALAELSRIRPRHEHHPSQGIRRRLRSGVHKSGGSPKYRVAARVGWSALWRGWSAVGGGSSFGVGDADAVQADVALGAADRGVA